MTRRYSYTTGLNRGGDTPTWEGDVTVSFSCNPGAAETGPSYACGGTPAEAPEIIDITLETVDGKARPWGMYSGYIADEDNQFEREVVEELEGSAVHMDAMLLIVGEAEAEDRESAAEYRAEQRRDDEMVERWEAGR